MKKILILALSLFSLAMTSCYDDYVSDYEWTGVSFARQYDVRTIVLGESSDIKVGVMMSGVLSNNKNRDVSYVIDNSLVNSEAINGFENHQDAYIKNMFTPTGVTSIEAMPSDWYACSNTDKMIIPKGNHLGMITVSIDKDKLISSSKDTRLPFFVIPFKITEASSVDSILENKSSLLVGIRYENKLFGDYWHGGVSVIKDANGNTLSTTPYYTAIPESESRVYVLSTMNPNSLTTNRIGNQSGSIKLTLKDDNTITVEKSSSSSVDVENDGDCYFNNSKKLEDRKIFLKYKFANNDGTTTHVTDTLTFRNRIRDGVNEWRSETAN